MKDKTTKFIGAHIDPLLWQQVKIYAAVRGQSIGTVVEEALRHVLNLQGEVAK